MAVGAESLENSPEVDLFAEFADRQITLFGVPGTIGELADSCPIDLSQVTTEAINRFVVKAVNEAGLEIEDKYVVIFDKILEQQGLERKYSVIKNEPDANLKRVEPEKPKATESKQTSEPLTSPTLPQKALEYRSRSENYVRQAEQQRLTGTLALNDIVQAELTRDVVKRSKNSEETSDKRLLSIATKDKISEAAVMPETPSGLKEKQDREVDIGSNSVVSRADGSGAVVFVAPKEPETTHEYPLELPDIPTFMTEVLPESAINLFIKDLDYDPPQNTNEKPDPINSEEHINMSLAYEVELAKQPLELLEDFTEGLAAYILKFNINTIAKQSDTIESDSLNDDIQLDESPEIIVNVFEGLKELDEEAKEEVSVILTNIVGALHGLSLLESSGAETEAKEVIKAQLENLCESLMTYLGINYDEDSLRRFVQAMQKPELISLILNEEEIALDLEHIGTHEAKHFKNLLWTIFTTASRQLICALGTFALSNSHRSEAL